MPLFILVFFLLGEYFLGRLLTPVNSAVYFRDEIRRINQLLEEYKNEYKKLVRAIEGGAAAV